MSATMRDAATVQLDQLEGGALWHARLCAPKGNVLDTAMTMALTQVFLHARSERAVKVVMLSGHGPHFSFGASVAEHLPERVGTMLPAFHRLFHAIADAGVMVLAAVRGQCLGGGLELAAFCHRVWAAPEARFGLPEITLGVFAPVGSLLLPERIGRAAADELCSSGRVVGATEAQRLGLVDELADEPVAAATAWAREQILPHSASSLRFAVRAVRREFHRGFFAGLEDLERLYLDELMATADAAEGIRAFLDKRAPRWSDA